MHRESGASETHLCLFLHGERVFRGTRAKKWDYSILEDKEGQKGIINSTKILFYIYYTGIKKYIYVEDLLKKKLVEQNPEVKQRRKHLSS